MACDESQKTLAAELVGLAMREAGDGTDPLEVKGRNGRIVGEGIARNTVGLLTGYLAEGDEKFGADSASAYASTALLPAPLPREAGYGKGAQLLVGFRV